MNYIPRIQYGAVPVLIQFEWPPEGDPHGEQDRGVSTTLIAATGVQQTNGAFVETTKKVKVNFVSKDVKEAFQAFFLEWGWLKKQFNYYPHSDSDAGLAAWSLVDDKIDYARVMPDDAGDFLYSFEFNLRRVIS